MKKLIAWLGILFISFSAKAQDSKTDTIGKTVSRKVLSSDVDSLPQEKDKKYKMIFQKGRPPSLLLIKTTETGVTIVFHNRTQIESESTWTKGGGASVGRTSGETVIHKKRYAAEKEPGSFSFAINAADNTVTEMDYKLTKGVIQKGKVAPPAKDAAATEMVAADGAAAGGSISNVSAKIKKHVANIKWSSALTIADCCRELDADGATDFSLPADLEDGEYDFVMSWSWVPLQKAKTRNCEVSFTLTIVNGVCDNAVHTKGTGGKIY